MSTNPLRREGAYWKPVLDYEHWEPQTPSPQTGTATMTPEPAVRHDLCQHCEAEFVVDSPFCRMCGHAKDSVVAREQKSFWQAMDFSWLQRQLGLSLGAMICFVLGLACIGAAVATGFLYTASTFGDWQAIQAWRSQWLVAAGVAFICGILLNNRKSNQS